MYLKQVYPFKDFQSDQIQKKFSLNIHCSLSMEEVTGTINRFIFQIINSLIESWGVHFTLTIKNCLHHVLTAPQVTSLLLFGPQAIPVTR